MSAGFRDLRGLGAAVTAWLAALGAVLFAFGSERDALSALLCAAPAALAAVLTLGSQADRNQYTIRLFAAGGLPPVGLLMVAADWPASAALLTALTVLHAAAFVAAVVLFAPVACAIAAPNGVAPVGADVLVARLRSLPDAGLPMRVQGERPSLVIEIDGDPARSHRVLLDIDAAGHRVTVRERLGAAGAAPRDAAEASMRSMGDPITDASRPNAQRVWSSTAQATQIQPAPLEAVRLRWSADGQAVAAAEAGAHDERSLVTLLAALVTRSGYAWQPRLFGRG